MAKRILHDFAALCDKVKKRNGVMRPAGVSTFGREIEWRAHRKATADGHKAGDILASNLTPSPGTDKNGPTAVIASHCKLDLSVLVNGTALDIKIYPGSITGEQGINALTGLYKTFLDLNGIFMHIDAVDNETLKDAQEHPEKYPTLAVRVSGWSARFVTLDKKWQTMIINRTLQK
jgi:formate C-acetyltransferase